MYKRVIYFIECKMWGLCYLHITLCFCVVVIKSKPPSCTTPNGETAECISLFSCPILKNAIASEDSSIKSFIEASSCGTIGQFMVCCGTFRNFTKSPKEPELLGNRNNGNANETATKESRREFVIKNLLPSKKFCGMQHTDDYFYNETVTSVDEFPWLLYIPLEAFDPFQQGLEWKCVGVLINNRYALTLSECASRFSYVKIGQYHKHQNVSCIPTSFGVDDCTEPIEVKVELRMGLPEGVMLLRLAENIIYTDYVRPICLPLEESDKLQVDDTVLSSGWGEEDSQGKYVMIKKRVEHMVVSNEKCTQSKIPTICTTGVTTTATIKNSTSSACKGDDGGPLMYKHGTNWFVAGIIDTNPTCFNNNYEPFRSIRITPQILEFLFEYMRP